MNDDIWQHLKELGGVTDDLGIEVGELLKTAALVREQMPADATLDQACFAIAAAVLVAAKYREKCKKAGIE